MQKGKMRNYVGDMLALAGIIVGFWMVPKLETRAAKIKLIALQIILLAAQMCCYWE